MFTGQYNNHVHASRKRDRTLTSVWWKRKYMSHCLPWTHSLPYIFLSQAKPFYLLSFSRHSIIKISVNTPEFSEYFYISCSRHNTSQYTSQMTSCCCVYSVTCVKVYCKNKQHHPPLLYIFKAMVISFSLHALHVCVKLPFYLLYMTEKNILQWNGFDLRHRQTRLVNDKYAIDTNQILLHFSQSTWHRP